MLTTTPFFVKTCFPKLFITLKLRALTEAVHEVSLESKGIIANFFDMRNGEGANEVRNRSFKKAPA